MRPGGCRGGGGGVLGSKAANFRKNAEGTEGEPQGLQAVSTPGETFTWAGVALTAEQVISKFHPRFRKPVPKTSVQLVSFAPLKTPWLGGEIQVVTSSESVLFVEEITFCSTFLTDPPMRGYVQ